MVSAWRFFRVPTSIACELVARRQRGTFHLQHPTLHVQDHLLVPKPVPKINTLDHRGGPFVAVDEREGLEHILDVAMAPVFAFDGGDRGDI